MSSPIILNSIVATGKYGGYMRLFLGEKFENIKTGELYTVTKFIWGKFHMLKLNDTLYGIMSIKDDIMNIVDANKDNIVQVRHTGLSGL